MLEDNKASLRAEVERMKTDAQEATNLRIANLNLQKVCTLTYVLRLTSIQKEDMTKLKHIVHVKFEFSNPCQCHAFYCIFLHKMR